MNSTFWTIKFKDKLNIHERQQTQINRGNTIEIENPGEEAEI